MNVKAARIPRNDSTKLRGCVCLSYNYSVKTRTISRLVTARTNDEWISLKKLALEVKAKPNTLQKTLKRLIDKKLVTRKRLQPNRGHWYFVYQSTELGQVRHELGGLPRGAKTLPIKELDVVVRSISEILDTKRTKYEDRQVIIQLDPYIAEVLRSYCSKPKKGDRAKQVKHAEDSYVIIIAKTGIATIRVRDPLKWDYDLIHWIQRCGISKKTSKTVIKQVLIQLPGGITRAEIPVLEQSIKRLEVKAHVETIVGGEFAVESNINYSMNEIGLEYFGTTRWVDALIRTLVAFQHSTVVSEVSRDKFIADIWETIEVKRKEEEDRLEKEKQKQRSPDYIV